MNNYKSKVTGQDVQLAVRAAGLTRIHLRECSICGYKMDYLIIDDQPYLDTSCYCTRHLHEPEHRTWQSIADHINIQPAIEARNRIRADFGMPPEENDNGRPSIPRSGTNPSPDKRGG